MKNKFLHVLNIFGLEWCLLIIALAYIDPTIAMLCLMFVGPIVAIALVVINILINKHGSRTAITEIFWVLRAISILLVLMLSILFVTIGIKQNSPEERLKSFIISPIPGSVANLKRGGNVYVMGGSSLYLTFDISPADFNAILGSQEFSKFYRNDVNNVTGRRPKLYKSSLNDAKKIIGDVAEMYVYEYSNSSYRCEILMVNKEHNKVYFRIH